MRRIATFSVTDKKGNVVASFDGEHIKYVAPYRVEFSLDGARPPQLPTTPGSVVRSKQTKTLHFLGEQYAGAWRDSWGDVNYPLGDFEVIFNADPTATREEVKWTP